MSSALMQGRAPAMIRPMLLLLEGPQAFLYKVCTCAGMRILEMGGMWE